MVRYYGWYSSRSRAKRRRSEVNIDLTRTVDPPHIKARRKRWAELIRQVFEVDPLTCTQCGGEMQILSFITPAQQNVIDAVCEKLKQSIEKPRSPDPPASAPTPTQIKQDDYDYSQLHW